jgi:hypothetical protein
MKKTLSFEKETLRTLVSAELDSVFGGAQNVSSPMPEPKQSSPLAPGGQKMSSAWDHAPAAPFSAFVTPRAPQAPSSALR